MATARQIEANRLNAQKSTGPRTETGKAVACLNATRHGILASVAVAVGEEQPLFDAGRARLEEELQPATPLEEALVEKILISLWRSRRLLQAEAAAISLRRRPGRIAELTSLEITRVSRDRVTEGDLTEFSPETITWLETVMAELPAAEQAALQGLEQTAPTIFEQLKEEAEDHASLQAYLDEEFDGALRVYLADLRAYCVGQLKSAQVRPALLETALQVVQAAAIPSLANQQLIARYQTMLDNQLFKAMRELRAAQAARIEALDAVG